MEWVPTAPAPEENASDGISRWELATARWSVRRFLATRPPLPGYDGEDLVQECLAHWCEQRSRHRAERGASPRTFMKRVLDAKLVDLEREAHAAKRGGRTLPLSLDAPLDGAPGTLGDLLPDSGNVADAVLARTAIQRATEQSSPRQAQILRALAAGESMAEISRLLGIAHATLHDERVRIARVFRDEGLDEFLR